MQLAEQKLFRNFDWILFAAVALIVALGVVMVYSATGAFIDFNDLINDYAVRQLIYAIVGLIAFGILTQVDYLVFARWRWVIYAAMIALLGIIFAIGQITHGAQRWIDFGSFQFQPSEIAKLMMVLVLAKFLADHEHDMSRWRNLALSFVVVALPALLVFLEPDLGTALIFLFSWAVMIVGAGISWRQIGALVGLTIILLPIIWFNLQSYQQQRVLTFLDPSSDPLGAGYNVRQAQIAIGTGGLWGRGIGAGIQSQLRFLRIRHADFIFSVIGEELGYWGSFFFFLLYVVILQRMLRAADLSRTAYGRNVAIGFAAALFFQTFVNIGMNIGLMPVTGIPMPYVSAGGTSLVSLMLMQGIVESIRMRQKTGLNVGKEK